MQIWARRSGWVVLLATLVAGCSNNDAEPGQVAVAPETSATQSGTPGGPPAPGATQQAAAVVIDPRLRQPFAEATLSDPPDGVQRPPDLTFAGKSAGLIYEEVMKRWDGIAFVAPSGKKLAYTATLDTDAGPIEIALLSDVAPNHVRSFVALAQAGYYDGLLFERTVHQQIEGRPAGDVLELIEGGCPVGTGEVGHGSIGYWLKPEFNAQVTHEEGTVGAAHGEQPESAACKFYINLRKAPFMDGAYTVFGKVTRGLDVARRIHAMPVRHDAEYPDGDRPVQPVVIRKVTVAAREVEN